MNFYKYLIVFLVSMLPIIELRGAIPIGLGAVPIGIDMSGLETWLVYVISILGNMLPVPFIYLFARKVLIWGSDKKYIGKFFTFCLEKGEKGGRKLEEKASKNGLFIALMLFVAIPLPGTGAWTGTLAASMLNFGFKRSTFSVLLGVLIAGILVGLASLGLLGIFNAFFAV